jgi:peptide/nickel transport system substrate-binding protein
VRRRATSRPATTSVTSIVLAVLALLTATLACTSPPSPRSAIVAGVVREPGSLLDQGDPGARFIAGLVFEKLVRYDEKDELVPRLAESVPSFENGMVRIIADERDASGRLAVTFVLRPDLVWHDGKPITSDDVAFAWLLGLAAPEFSVERADAALVERVETIDARVVVFHLKPGVRTARYPLLARAMPRHILAGPDPARDRAYASRPVHAGPFTIVSWQEGAGLTLAPFERYALGSPGLSRIEVRFFPDREALLAALEAGRIDTVPAGPFGAEAISHIESFAEARRLSPRYVPQQAADVLLFNVREPPYDDVRARLAVALAVDRRSIVQDVFGGRPRLPASFLFAPSWAAADVDPLPDSDRSAALSLLAAAGHCASTRCPEVPPMRARIGVEAGPPARATVAQRIVAALGAVGVDASIVTLEPSNVRRALSDGDVDLALVSGAFGDPAEAAAEYVTGSPTNVTGFSDGWFDLLARAAARAFTRPERRPLYAELQRLWTANLPGLPIHQHIGVDVVPDGLEGVRPAAHGEPLSWNAHAWRFRAEDARQ